MRKVYAIADNITSPIGFNSEENWNSLLHGKTGVKVNNKVSIYLKNFYASLFEEELLKAKLEQYTSSLNYTRLEQMYIHSVQDALNHCDIKGNSDRTLFIFSSTKGNISLLENEVENKKYGNRIAINAMAKVIASYFKNPNEPVVVSNACISGVLAMIVGSYYIREGVYDNVIISGGDIISEFTVSGFNSLLAISQGECKPFDKSRDGINLGEACATVILSANKLSPSDIEINSGATSNDANHISGPSKTGDGLALAITNSLSYAKLNASDIGFVSAHGTATLYNDEMEAKAFHLAKLDGVPLNSLKGYFGHTLGAAGVLETIISMYSLKNQYLIASRGYSEHGVSLPLEVIKANGSKSFGHCLKTASGFGGCNASLILSSCN